MLATGKREDIYSDVAKVAIQRIARDAADGRVRDGDGDEQARAMHAAANGWLGKVGRKTVKRAEMTPPYGVTAPGIKTQLITDGFCAPFENGAERCSTYRCPPTPAPPNPLIQRALEDLKRREVRRAAKAARANAKDCPDP